MCGVRGGGGDSGGKHTGCLSHAYVFIFVPFAFCIFFFFFIFCKFICYFIPLVCRGLPNVIDILLLSFLLGLMQSYSFTHFYRARHLRPAYASQPQPPAPHHPRLWVLFYPFVKKFLIFCKSSSEHEWNRKIFFIDFSLQKNDLTYHKQSFKSKFALPTNVLPIFSIIWVSIITIKLKVFLPIKYRKHHGDYISYVT